MNESKNNLMSKAERCSREELVMDRIERDKEKFIEALKNGTLACLPNDIGYADTQPVINGNKDSKFHGITLLLLKEHMRRNGCKGNEYITFSLMDVINKKLKLVDYSEKLTLKKGSKSESIFYYAKVRDSDGKYVSRLEAFTGFNVDQVRNANRIADYWKVVNQERKIRPRVQVSDKDRAVEIFFCETSEPVDYLGQYLAAVSRGSFFKASKPVAEEFVRKCTEYLESPECRSIYDFSRAINDRCMEYCAERRRLEQEKKLEKNGMGM